jgi:hypothetical protein
MYLALHTSRIYRANLGEDMAGLDELTEYLLALYRNRETQPDLWRAALEALQRIGFPEPMLLAAMTALDEDMSPVKVVDEVSLTREGHLNRADPVRRIPVPGYSTEVRPEPEPMTLRRKVREALASKSLPPANLGSSARRGSGRPCFVCDQPIGPHDVERNVRIGRRGDRTVVVHEACYLLWRVETIFCMRPDLGRS